MRQGSEVERQPLKASKMGQIQTADQTKLYQPTHSSTTSQSDSPSELFVAPHGDSAKLRPFRTEPLSAGNFSVLPSS